MHKWMATDNLGNLSSRSLFHETKHQEQTKLLCLKKTESKRGNQLVLFSQNPIWPVFGALCLSWWLPSIQHSRLTVCGMEQPRSNVLHSVNSYIFSAFDWLTHSVVAAPWPGLTGTHLDSGNSPCCPVFGTVPTLSCLALVWVMETLCPFHSRRRTPPPSGDHFPN